MICAEADLKVMAQRLAEAPPHTLFQEDSPTGRAGKGHGLGTKRAMTERRERSSAGSFRDTDEDGTQK